MWGEEGRGVEGGSGGTARCSCHTTRRTTGEGDRGPGEAGRVTVAAAIHHRGQLVRGERVLGRVEKGRKREGQGSRRGAGTTKLYGVSLACWSGPKAGKVSDIPSIQAQPAEG